MLLRPALLLLCLLCACLGAAFGAGEPVPTTPPALPTPPAAAIPGGLAPALAGDPSAATLYPGDLVRLAVFDNPELSADLRVSAEGEMVLPLVGGVPTYAGKTVNAAAADIRKRLEEKYLRSAIVTLTVVEYGPRHVYVMGAVGQQQAINLAGLATALTATQAIAQAGGYAENANRTAARLIRTDPENHDKKLALAIPPSDKPEDLANDIPLRPGDVLVVPRLDRVYVVGRVTKPGAIDLPANQALTVGKAISLCGGFDRFAKETQVQLLRAGQPTATVNVQGVLLSQKGVEDPALKPGDIVYVPESSF